MNLADAFKIALSNLRQRGLRSWLTLIGIFAGIASIVALISLGQGLEVAIAEQFSSFGVNTISIRGAGSSFGPPGTNAIGELNDRDALLIQRLNEVDFVIPRYVKGVTAEYRDETEQLFASSIAPGENGRKIYDLLNLNIDRGREVLEGDDTKVVLGPSVDFNDIKPDINHKIEINGKTFTIAGILKQKGNPIFDNSLLMTEAAMQDLLGLEEDYSFLVASVKEGEDVVEARETISRTIRRDRGQQPGEEDFEVSSPQDALNSLNEILVIVQILLVGIAFISLIVGSIGILNTMYTAVLERRMEIGIMKSIGAKNNDILSIFLIESGLLGLAGGLLGLIIGGSISKLVEIAAFAAFGESILKTSFPLWLILGSVIFAFLIGTLSGTLPARQASKLQPVDALRK